MEPEEITGGGFSRRTMLKGIGAGTAIAWAAPALTTVGGRVMAQTSPACTDCAVGGNDCGGQTPCGDGCTCLRRTGQRGCFCHEPISCGDPRVVACTTDATCPAGWSCTSSCCGSDLCHPPCGATLGAQAAGPKSTG